MTRLTAVLRQLPCIILFPLTVVLCLQLVACSGGTGGDSGKANGQAIPAVEAVQLRYGSLPLTERLSGLVKARNQVELFPQLTAAVAEVYIQNGDLVRSGQPLVRLRDTEFREQLKQAEASYQITVAQAKQADAEYNRIQRELERSISLSKKNLLSTSELEIIETQAIAAEANTELAQARVEQAQATVDERKEELSRTIIRAPVDGTVGNRNVEIGMLVAPNSRLFTLGQLDSIKVEVVLTDRMLSYIREGQRSEILSQTMPSGQVTAPVARISPFLHPVTHTTKGEIDLVNPEGSLKPGMFVTVDIFYGESEQATLVPLSALWENPATATVGVFVCRDSLNSEPVATLDSPRGGSLTAPVTFEFLPVDVVARGRMYAGVRGVDAGRWVVTIGQDLLSADSATARVRPVNSERVEKLQQLQRENLLEEVIQRQKTGAADSSLIGSLLTGLEALV